MTFHGEFRGGVESKAEAAALPDSELVLTSDEEEKIAEGDHAHMAESPLVMVLPMGVLAVLSVVSGFVANAPFKLLTIPKHWISEFLVAPLGHPETPEFIGWVAILSIGLALAGVGLAWAIYAAGKIAPERLTYRPLYQLTMRKYYMDDLYERFIVGQVFYRYSAGLLDWFDRVFVDGVSDNIGWFGRNIGRGIATMQNGQVQAYGGVFTVGAVIILLVYLIK
jgi:NADH-quinone oxidoreductase subunit L